MDNFPAHRRPGAGFALIELVIALGIVSALSAMGFGGIRAMVSSMALHAAAEHQTTGLQGLRGSLQRAIDQRPGTPLEGGDWTELETEAVAGLQILKRMTVATTLPGGGPARWELRRVGDGWEYGLEAEGERRELAGYRGRILAEALREQSGPGTGGLRLRFVDAMQPGPRLGFAFGRFW